MANQMNAHWRDSSRNPRFFMVDAMAAIPLLFVLLHIRWWTFLLALGFMVFFGILEKFNFTVPVFFRWLRAFIAGPLKTAYPWWRM